MPDYREQYGASAWLSTRQAIGEELRKRYETTDELPRHLHALARQLSPPLPKEFPSLATDRHLSSPTQQWSVMNRRMLVNYLGHAERHIRDGERHILRQRQIIDDLERHGHGQSLTANVARDILQSYEMAQSAYIVDRGRRQQALER